METVRGLLGEDGKRIYIVGRAVAVVLSIIAGAFSLVIGAHRYLDEHFDRGPAIVFHAIRPWPVFASQIGRVDLTFDKKRDCLPESAFIVLKDKSQNTWTSEIDWNAPFDIEDGIKTTKTWNVPADLPNSTVMTGRVVVRHYKCRDGKDPSESAHIDFEGLKVM
jgi:hypothetical protein